ncbi:lipid-A-disaccharide synthase [soil metagenome]
MRADEKGVRPLFGVVAGEASGDLLGAGLIQELRGLRPELQFAGVAGPAMRREGCEAWVDADALAVMGLTEVLRHLPRLIRTRRALAQRFLAERPVAFVGIDAPDFNLGLEQRLRDAGIPTVHYVSPSVWAWRQNRLQVISRACDLVLCLLPFEQALYDRHGIRATFVGHPLADEIPLDVDRPAARRALDLPASGPVVAVLPGSRVNEVSRLGPDFAAAIDWLATRRPELHFVAAMANSRIRELFETQLRDAAHGRPVRLLDGGARQALAAADAALVASGTATLEAALLKCPMVVAYRVSRATEWALERLLKVERYALPNLLAGRDIVPELLQDAVTPAALGGALLEQLEDEDRRGALEAVFGDLHRELRRGANRRSAEAVLELVAAGR